MRITRYKGILVSLLVTLGATFSLAASPFKIEIQPVFQGSLAAGKVCPLEVHIRNSGPDARGKLEISNSNSLVSYPIELPQGADKSLMVFPSAYYGSLNISLNTDRGATQFDFAMPTDREEGMHVLLMSDVAGEMSFIRSIKTQSPQFPAPDGYPVGAQNAASLLDCYSRPGSSPTRPIGYDSVSTIVLGTGSERLSDDEIEAIKSWVTLGHTLVFIGGASAPILSDQRWAALLPAHNFHVAKLAHSSVLTNLATAEAPDTTITTGDPVLGASTRKDGSLLISAEKPFGIGRVLYLSFNPFEAPLNRWEGRQAVVTRLIRMAGNLAGPVFLNGLVGNNDVSSPLGGPSGTPRYKTIKDDPFDTKLPPVSRIGWILASYFILVVPINFLFLKKLKKGELAWITAPLISLGFAGLLFTSAGGLYGAKMSTVSTGVIVAQEGMNSSIYSGFTQMFIPTGGSYDLKLTNIDSLDAVVDDDFPSYRSRKDSRDFEAIDEGEFKIPNLSSNNLAFKSLSYKQKIPVSKWFHVHLRSTGLKSASCEITNSGPFTLVRPTLAVGNDFITLSDLKPGDRVTKAIQFLPKQSTENLNGTDVRNFTAGKNRAALSGDLIGFRPGPQLGTEITSRSSIKLFLFSDWEGTE